MKVNAWKLTRLPDTVAEFAVDERYKEGKNLFRGKNIGWCTTKLGLAALGNIESIEFGEKIISTNSFSSLNLGNQKTILHSRLKSFFRSIGFVFNKKSDLFFVPKSFREDGAIFSKSSQLYINSGFKYSIEKLSNRFVLLINPFQVITEDGENYDPKYSRLKNSIVLADPYLSPKYRSMVEMYKYIMSIVAPNGKIEIDCGPMGSIVAVGSGDIKDNFIQEPSAYFGAGKQNQWPKLGLNRFGPLDYNIGKSTTPSEVKVAFVGSGRSTDLLRSLKNGNTEGRYPFKGFDKVFHSNLVMGSERFMKISQTEIDSISSSAEIVDLIFSKIVQLRNKDIDFDITLIELPLEWSEYYTGQEKDLHDIIKVKAYSLKVSTQLFQEDQFSQMDTDDLLSNLSLGIYYKAGGEPWRIDTNFESIAYVGISFGFSESENRKLIGVAEIFDAYGQFVSLRSLTVKEKELDEYFDMRRDTHMSEDQLHGLLNNLLVDYYQFMDETFPENMIVHKTTYFNESEKNAIEALSSIPTQVTMVYTQASHNWHLINNREPTRGFYLRLSNRKLLLYTSGVMQGQSRYSLPGAPKPYLIEIQGDGNFTIEEIAEQIMELSKLNFNSTNSYSRHPVTLLHSKKIVNLLRVGLLPSDIPSDPRFYI